MILTVQRMTQPTCEPVSLEKAKDALRIPRAQSVDDDYITGLISAARECAEQFIDRPICEANFVIAYSHINASRFSLGYPASEVTAVTYRDENGDEQEASFTYDQGLNELFFTRQIVGAGLKVSIKSGQKKDFPESLKHAILMIIADLYTGRASAEFTNKAAQMMLMPFKNRPIV